MNLRQTHTFATLEVSASALRYTPLDDYSMMPLGLTGLTAAYKRSQAKLRAECARLPSDFAGLGG